MVVFATTLLSVSIVGLSALFAFKAFEIRRGAVIAPQMRRRLDKFARITKLYILGIGYLIETLPSRLVLIARVLLHAGAVGAARLARMAEERAHQIADLVSHRHRFERRETNSIFLKQVGEHKSDLNGEREKRNKESGQ